MSHLLYLMFRCDGKFGGVWGSEHSLGVAEPKGPGRSALGGSYMDAVAGWGWAVGFDLRLLRP